MTPLLLFFLFLALLVLFAQGRKIKAKEQEVTQARADSIQQAATAAARETQLQHDLDQLSRYRPILDAEQHARQVRTAADNEAATLLTRAQSETRYRCASFGVVPS